MNTESVFQEGLYTESVFKGWVNTCSSRGRTQEFHESHLIQNVYNVVCIEGNSDGVRQGMVAGRNFIRVLYCFNDSGG